MTLTFLSPKIPYNSVDYQFLEPKKPNTTTRNSDIEFYNYNLMKKHAHLKDNENIKVERKKPKFFEFVSPKRPSTRVLITKVEKYFQLF